MSRQTWVETLAIAMTDGPALTNSTTPTSILPAHAKCTLPPCFFEIGRALAIKASGRISNVATTPGTLTLSLRFGAVTVWTSQAMALNVVAKTNVAWTFDLLATCRSIGSGTSGTMFGQGIFVSESVVGSPLISVGGNGVFNAPASAPTVGTGFDTTATNQVDLFAEFSVNTATTSITLHQFILQSVN